MSTGETVWKIYNAAYNRTGAGEKPEIDMVLVTGHIGKIDLNFKPNVIVCGSGGENINYCI